MEIIEKIRKEIEKAREQLKDSNYYLDNSEQALGYSAALDDMSKAINSFIREEMSKNMDEIVMTPLEILSKKCKQEEIDPQIAQCIADHWWEMAGEETPTDIEEAAYKKVREMFGNDMVDYGGHSQVDASKADGLFIAGAEWMKEQMMKDYSWLIQPNPNIEPPADLIHTTDTAPADGKELLYVADKSYKIGWRDCKEQMMKEAIDLVDAVEKYVVQGCSRSTLLAKKDKLKKLIVTKDDNR